MEMFFPSWAQPGKNVMNVLSGGFRYKVQQENFCRANSLPSVCDKLYQETIAYQSTCYTRQPRMRRISAVCRSAKAYGIARYAVPRSANEGEKS